MILVNATAYNAQGTTETVVVNRSDIIIRSVNGRAEVKAGGADDHVFNIANQTNVTLQGFEIRDARGTGQDVAGIWMNNASDCNISDNIVTNISATGEAYGIMIVETENVNSSDTTINDILGNDSAYGIYLEEDSNNNSFNSSTSISNLDGTDVYGICLDPSNDNDFNFSTVSGLNASNNAYGIYLSACFQPQHVRQ